MKKFQLCLATIVLMISLAAPTLAGDMYGGIVQPPPAPATPTPAPVGGEIGYGVAGDMATGSSESVAGVGVSNTLLNLLESTLSLF